jgi:hypothetical protein
MNQRIKKASQRTLNFLVEDVSLFAYLAFFVIAVTIFGALYALLTPLGHGVGQSGSSLHQLTLLDGLYFSIVTVSSLGYGDIHPMGASRALACLEVIMGLSIMGVMIAKVTSRRLSYHVQRLFSSDAQKRLEDIAAMFDISHDELSAIMPQLTTVYQSTPGGASPPDKTDLISKFRDAVAALQARCASLSTYLSYESEQGNFFSVAPNSAIVRVGESVDGVFYRLSQLIISLPPQARTELLDRHNRQKIADAIQSQKQVCGVIRQNVDGSDVLGVFERISETCERVPGSYFAVPEEAQPDQFLEHSDEPQDV